MNRTSTRSRARFLQGSWRSPGCHSLAVLCSQPVWAQAERPEDTIAAPSVSAAPVIVDGNQLFTVRGITSYPAQARAAMIREHIIAAARDETIAVKDIHSVESEDRTQIYAGKIQLLAVFDLDAENEGIDRKLLAAAFATKSQRQLTSTARTAADPCCCAIPLLRWPPRYSWC